MRYLCCLLLIGLVGCAAGGPVVGPLVPEEWEVSGAPPVIRRVVDGRVLLEARAVAADINVALDVGSGEPLTLTATLPESGEGAGVTLQIHHHIDNPRHLWIPHLAPEEGYVIGDHAFRSPAVILADDEVAVALIPDLDDVAAGFEAGWLTWMDYDHPKKVIKLTAGKYVTHGHVFYKKAPLKYAGQKVKLRMHVLVSRKPCDLANPYGMTAEFIWQRWGKPRHEEGGSQLAPLSAYMDYVVDWAFSPEKWGDTVWQSFVVDGRQCGAPAFIVDVAQHPSVPMDERKWREQRSVWNQAWFSTQRCANGLYRYGRHVESSDLKLRANLMTAFALAAPQDDGLFPSVYTTARPDERKWYQLYKDTPGWDEGRWSNSDRRPGGTSEQAVHVLDAAFTARLLLEWYDLVGGGKEVKDYVMRFADRLVRLQRESGAFPGWVEPDGEVQPVLAEGPESAMSAALLLELYQQFPEHTEWRDSARKALDYLEKGPVAEARWEDFETYFSCNSWGRGDRIGKRIERNGIYKQNTFSPFWCAEAFLAAYRVFGDAKYLALGQRCLDELSLQQQVWDPPFIAAPCHGGFGVMNADGEWNDARQSLFAPLYMEYYKETGQRSYFERGVAAVRASFAMLYCPENEQVRKQYEMKHPFFGQESYGFMMENIAHTGPAPADGSAIGVFTIFTWGNGAALATAAKVRDLYGDVYVDSTRRMAFSIDGFDVCVDGGGVAIKDRFGRESASVVYENGTRRTVELRDGGARVPLRP